MDKACRAVAFLNRAARLGDPTALSIGSRHAPSLKWMKNPQVLGFGIARRRGRPDGDFVVRVGVAARTPGTGRRTDVPDHIVFDADGAAVEIEVEEDTAPRLQAGANVMGGAGRNCFFVVYGFRRLGALPPSAWQRILPRASWKPRWARLTARSLSCNLSSNRKFQRITRQIPNLQIPT